MEDERYNVREVDYNGVLEFHQSGVTLQLTIIRTYPRKGYFTGWFYIMCLNNSSDTVVIPYDSISLETDKGNVEEMRFLKRGFLGSMDKVNIKKKPFWKISPFDKGEGSIDFKIRPKEISTFDRNNIITVKIQQIHKVVSNINMKFEGNFKVEKESEASF